MIHEFETQQADSQFPSRRSGLDLLVEPHGPIEEHEISQPDLAARGSLFDITLSETDLLDCEQLAIGTYAPINGFMDQTAIETVLHKHCLPDGTAWTLPIVLQVDAKQGRRISAGTSVALRDAAGITRYLLDVTDSAAFEGSSVSALWFGTEDKRHPGVARLLAAGDWRLAGRVFRIAQTKQARPFYQLTPSESRFIFAQKGWSQVVGFHTRNAVHRVHEYVQLKALEETGADGLYISPVLGPKKPGDFLAGPIMNSYERLLEFGIYPRERVVLGSFATFPRYCGPREAVFTALCRKNMGCSHIIIGRDHTGVGDYYPADANRLLFESLGHIGIAPIFFDAVGYNTETQQYGSAAEVGELASISGSEIRRRLQSGDPLPDWFMRDVVQDMLRTEIAHGRPIFEGQTLPELPAVSPAPLTAAASAKRRRSA
jgi:ATP sulfurylase